ncbi:MAG: ABC transporter permease [Chloroflexota bacterium]
MSVATPTRAHPSLVRGIGRKPSVGLGRLGAIIAVLAIWEAITRGGLVDPLFLASPDEVAREVFVLATRPDLRAAYANLGFELALAFVLGTAIAVPLGVALGLSTYLYRVFNPIVVMLFGIPQITVLPLFILVLGIGPSAKIAFGVTHTVFPIIFTCIAGCRSVDRQLLRAAHSMGATRSQIFSKLVVPSILPWIVTGLRLGMASNLLGILLAELFVSQNGIGFFVRRFTSSFKSAQTLGLVTTLALFAIVLSELLRYAERRLSAWRT